MLAITSINESFRNLSPTSVFTKKKKVKKWGR